MSDKTFEALHLEMAAIRAALNALAKSIDTLQRDVLQVHQSVLDHTARKPK